MRKFICVGAFALITATGLIAGSPQQPPAQNPDKQPPAKNPERQPPAQSPEKHPVLQGFFGGHLGGVTAITFNLLGDRFASGSGNGIVRIWNPTFPGGVPQAKLEEFRGISITGLSLSPDGRRLAASGKGKVGMWSELESRYGASELPNGKFAPPKSDYKYNWVQFPGTESESTYSDVAITGDGKDVYFTRRHISNSFPGRVLRYDILRDVTEERPGPKFMDPRSVACIPDPDSTVAAAYTTLDKGESAVLLYGLGDVKIITRGVPSLTKTTSQNLPQRIAYSTDGHWLAAYCGTLAVWPVPGSQIIGGEPATFENVYAAAIGPNNVLATVPPPNEFQNTPVTLWKLENRTRHFTLFGVHWLKETVEVKKLETFDTTLRNVGCLAFSPTGSILAVGGITDGAVQIWGMK